MSFFIASGQVNQFAIASGAVTSGRLGVTGTPDGSKFLRDDFTWQAVSGGIASGSVGHFQLADQAVLSGNIGSGQISSGMLASGLLNSIVVNPYDVYRYSLIHSMGV